MLLELSFFYGEESGHSMGKHRIFRKEKCTKCIMDRPIPWPTNTLSQGEYSAGER